MKLTTLASTSPDGCLHLVNRDLTHCLNVSQLSPTLQYTLDHWNEIFPALQNLEKQLEDLTHPLVIDYHQAMSLAPLPRAYQFLDASAYVHHVELARQARGEVLPPHFWDSPLMYQGVSDTFLSCQASISKDYIPYGLDFEAEIAVITDFVPANTQAQHCLKHIKLLLLLNDISLRNLIPSELSKGFGFLQSKPPCSCSPITVTPDELQDSWHHGKVHLPLESYFNDVSFGRPDAGKDMVFHFGELIAHACKTRPLQAGTIIGSGTVSNTDFSSGSSCIVEKRMLQKIHNEKMMDYMTLNDRITIRMHDRDGFSIFGSIQQQVR